MVHIHLIKAVENMPDVPDRDSRTGISNYQTDISSISSLLSRKCDSDSSILRGKLKRIGQQIKIDTFHLSASNAIRQSVRSSFTSRTNGYAFSKPMFEMHGSIPVIAHAGPYWFSPTPVYHFILTEIKNLVDQPQQNIHILMYHFQ